MTIRCTIETGEPTARLRDIFATELERTHARSSVALEDDAGDAILRIEANDLTALRAAVNGVMSVLSVYAKVTHEL